MSAPTPLVDSMTGEVVGYEIKPGDDPVAIGRCAACGGTISTWDPEVLMVGDNVLHPLCGRGWMP